MGFQIFKNANYGRLWALFKSMCKPVKSKPKAYSRHNGEFHQNEHESLIDDTTNEGIFTFYSILTLYLNLTFINTVNTYFSLLNLY